MPDPSVLRRISQTIESGEPVDWEKEIASHPDLAPELRRMRLAEVDATRTIDLTDAEPFAEWGPLRILEQIGAGGFGEVFRATDLNLDREVALKLRHAALADDPEAEERFLDEARTLARVRHPNVLTVHGAGRHNGRVGLWTDLVRGKTLEELLKQQGTFGADEAALIGIDLCRALAAVHGAGLVHRDVKTGNVMREEGGRIVLLDFSAVSEREGERETSLAGTPVFMAPETLRGETSDTRSDIYSLGVVLYRLVSGRFPVDAENFSELRDRRLRGESIPLRDVRSDLPAAFVQVVERALETDPARRHASAGEMERALAASLGTPRQASAPAEPDRAVAQPTGRRRLLVGMIGVLMIGAVLVLQLSGAFSGPYEVEAALFRLKSGAAERLQQGGSLSMDDRLFLEIEGSKSMHVYVLNEDESGDSHLMFPRPDVELQNPLDAKRRHRLPGVVDGRDFYWGVTSSGGNETFLVVASRKPVESLEERFRQEALQFETRGVGGLSPAESPSRGDSSLGEIHRHVTAESAARSGIWYWQIDLENLGPAPETTGSDEQP